MLEKLTREDARIEYEDIGTGSPIMFLHGWASGKSCWREVTARLSKTHRCITVDLRGHGNSRVLGQGSATIEAMADDVSALLEALDMQGVVLTAHSMGGMVAFDYIMRYGCARLAGLIIMDMSPKITSDADWPYGERGGSLTQAQVREEEALLRAEPAKFVFDFTCRFHPQLARRRAELRNIVDTAMLGIADPKALADAWHSVGTADRRTCLPGIAVPTLYMIPSEPLFPPEIAEYYAKKIPAEVSIVRIANSGHLLMQDNPAEVSGAMEKYLRRIRQMGI